MRDHSAQNPYAPPQSTSEDPAPATGSSLHWKRWIAGTIVAEALLTGLAVRYFPRSAAVMIFSGCFLTVITFISAKRHQPSHAHFLAQALNLTVWATMITTIYFLVPFRNPGLVMNARHLQNVVNLWLVGTFGVWIVSAIGGAMSRKNDGDHE